MVPKTPPGLKGCVSTSIPPQAADERASKKYVHSSALAATKETVTLGARASFSHSSEMMVDLRRRSGFFARLLLREDGDDVER